MNESFARWMSRLSRKQYRYTMYRVEVWNETCNVISNYVYNFITYTAEGTDYAPKYYDERFSTYLIL